MKLALGLIETKGLIGAIEAADAMVKAAQVKLIAKEKVTGAMINIQIVGEVAAVKSAVDAGAAAAQRVGELISAHVIPRPDDQMDKIISFDAVSEELPLEEHVEEVTEKTSVEEVKPESSEVPPVEIDAESTDSVDDNPAQEEDAAGEREVEVEEGDETELKTEIKAEVENKSNALLSEESEDEEEQRLFSSEIPLQEELEKLNVHQLRHLARSYENFPIKGREISKANRGTLIDYFNSMR